MSVEETIVYELVLVQPASRKVLAVEGSAGRSLPRVQVPRWTRPAEQLQKAIRATYGLDAIILDFPAAQEGGTRRAIAELLTPNTNSELSEAALDDISVADPSLKSLESFGFSGNTNPLSHVGWIDDAIRWVETATGRRLSSKSEIRQFNAGGRFSLICFPMEDCREYWLKATGEANAHEYSVTTVLCELASTNPAARETLPALISTKPQWNAWLMSGEAVPISETAEYSDQPYPILSRAVRSFARLQIATIGREDELIRAGAFDQRLKELVKRSAELFGYIEEAMELQVSTKAVRLERQRLRELHAVLVDVCNRMADLELPDCIVHGDLNCGNILLGEQLQFIDWSEAFVGNPLIALEHLILLNRVRDAGERERSNDALKQEYCREWRELCPPLVLSEGLRYMPLIAAASALYGRGQWLTSPERNTPLRQSFSRTMARNIDRAAHALESAEAVCQ